MTDKPLDRAGRQAARARIRRQVLARAEREIAILGRSMTCGEYGRHETSPGGTTCAGAACCLCSCHDPGESS